MGDNRKRCTCKRSCLLYGSYYCDPAVGWCRKDQDKKWWKVSLKREKQKNGK